MKKLLYQLGIAAMIFLGTSAYLSAQECYTPIEWIPKNYVSNLDRNKNFVDDAIDAMHPDKTVDIILCLNSCASQTDMDRFKERLGVGVTHRSPYLSIVIYEGVTVAAAVALGKDGRVAMVELVREAEFTNDVSVRAAKIRSSADYSGANVEDVHPAITGAGINIAIMDSGVDNIPAGGGTGHESFPAWKYVAGYDAVPDIEMDPDDDHSHGTHVAGIALGTGGVSGTYRGNAPGAGLVDIRIGGIGGIPTAAIFRGYDKIIERRVAWGIKVVNMSFRAGVHSNGTDAHSQMVNRIVREGVVVAIAASNDGPANSIPPPAAADFAITVASAFDQGTIQRIGDVISGYSSRGPRLNDGDGITEDEQKPDVTAYGQTIHSAQFNTTSGYVDMSGTSMASPQVAGLAALILQANPGMDPLSVKDLIESTAEDFGAPGWDIEFGHGIINGFTAVDQVISSLQTDIAFNDYCGNPANPQWWLSTDVVPQNPSVIEGTANGVTVTIYNNGATTALNVKVRVGIYNFSNSTADFDICMHNIAVLPPGPYTFTCPWTPEADGLTPSVVHACLKAYIIYPSDTDPSNNCAQHNVNIQQTHSPALFHMTVVNPTGEEALMEIVTDPPAEKLEAQGWKLTTEKTSFRMGANECPKTVTIAMEAVGQNPAKEIPVNITIQRRKGQETEILGGVQMIGQNGNGTPRPPDKAVFAGIRHTSLGQARLHSAPARLTVSDIGEKGNDGVEAWLGQANFWRGTLEEFNTEQIRDRGFISFSPRGMVDGKENAKIAEMRITNVEGKAQFSSDFQTGSMRLIIEVYRGSELVDTRLNSDGAFANVQSPSGIQITPFRSKDGTTYGEVGFGTPVEIEALGSTSSTIVTGDRIVVYPRTQPALPSYVEKAEILSNCGADFALTGEAGGAYQRPFRSMGNPVLDWSESGKLLTASRVTARSAVGVTAEVPDLKSYQLTWSAADMDKVPTGAQLSLAARGRLAEADDSDLGSVSATRVPSGAQITADFAQLGVNSYTALIYNDGQMVYEQRDLKGIISTAGNWPNRGGIVVEKSTGGMGYVMGWPEKTAFALADDVVVEGNEIHILPENMNQPLSSISQLGVYAVGMDKLQIIGEESTSAIPVSVGTPEQERHFRLYQNYPNPFDQHTIFKFDLFSSAYVELEIYNLLGEKVASVTAREFAQGTHEVEWKRPNTSLPSGAYIYRMKVRPVHSDQTFELQRQMVILD